LPSWRAQPRHASFPLAGRPRAEGCRVCSSVRRLCRSPDAAVFPPRLGRRHRRTDCRWPRRRRSKHHQADALREQPDEMQAALHRARRDAQAAQDCAEAIERAEPRDVLPACWRGSGRRDAANRRKAGCGGPAFCSSLHTGDLIRGDSQRNDAAPDWCGYALIWIKVRSKNQRYGLVCRRAGVHSGRRGGANKGPIVPYRPTLLASCVESYRLPNPIKS
jgi:hypothetical protein